MAGAGSRPSHAWRGTYRRVSLSGTKDTEIFWKLIQSYLPDKFKMFSWKLLHNCLPDVIYLRKRQCHVDLKCFFCGVVMGSICHLVRDSWWSRVLWNALELETNNFAFMVTIMLTCYSTVLIIMLMRNSELCFVDYGLFECVGMKKRHDKQGWDCHGLVVKVKVMLGQLDRADGLEDGRLQNSRLGLPNHNCAFYFL